MLHRILSLCSLFVLFTSTLFLPLTATATSQHTELTSQPRDILDFPVPDPLYIYNQFAYVTSHFQHREAGYTINQGHDQFAAYWTQEMMHNLAGFGPHARRDEFPIQGWRNRPASLPAFNMEVTVPGLTHPEQEIIVGCHYDGRRIPPNRLLTTPVAAPTNSALARRWPITGAAIMFIPRILCVLSSSMPRSRAFSARFII